MTHSLPSPLALSPHHPSSPLGLRSGIRVAVASWMYVAGLAMAQHQHPASPQPPTAAPAPQIQPTANSGLPWVGAEVRRVDAAAGKVTLKHDAIPNLDMPGMTMVFAVAQPQMLQGLLPGDKIQIGVEKVGGQYTVQALRR